MPPASGDGDRSSTGAGTARFARPTASSITSRTVIDVSIHTNPCDPSGHTRSNTTSVRPSGNSRPTEPSGPCVNWYPDGPRSP